LECGSGPAGSSEAAMTTDRTYRCNLCADSIAPHEAEDFKVAGKGIHWDNQRISFRPVTDTEHHICCNCISGLRELLDTRGNP
jgi:hypothetical protein